MKEDGGPKRGGNGSDSGPILGEDGDGVGEVGERKDLLGK